MEARLAIFLLVLALVAVPGCGGPDRAEAQAQALSLYRDGGHENWVKAERLLRPGVDSETVDLPHLNLYMLCLDRLDERERSVELARQVLKTYPDHFMTNSILGGLLFDMGKYTEAAAALNFAHDARPDHLDTLVLLTASSGMAGLDDAEPLYRHLLEDSAYRDTPKAFVPHNELAVWLIRKERYDDALDELVRAKELSENHPMIYLNLAILYDMHLNDPAKARGYYTKFLLVGEIKYPEQGEAVRRRLRTLTVPSPGG